MTALPLIEARELSGHFTLRRKWACGSGQVPHAAERERIARDAAHFARQGITTAINMDGNLCTLEREGLRSLQVKVPFHFKPWMDLSILDCAEAMARDCQGDRIFSGHVKMFMDGVFDSGTDLTVGDYPGRPGWRREPLFEPGRFAEIAAEADRRGPQIAVHAIGDSAVRVVLDGDEAARRANGPGDSRHRVEHFELTHPDDLPRPPDVVASAQVEQEGQ